MAMAVAVACDAKCAICGKKYSYSHTMKNGNLSIDLSNVVFCEECRKRLKALLYNKQEVTTNG